MITLQTAFELIGLQLKLLDTAYTVLNILFCISCYNGRFDSADDLCDVFFYSLHALFHLLFAICKHGILSFLCQSSCIHLEPHRKKQRSKNDLESR